MKPRTWFRIHSFAGVITGLLLFVICWSGTFATLAHEIDWLVTPEMRLARALAGVDWERVHDAAADAYPNARLEWLQSPRNSWAAAEAVVRLPTGVRRKVYVDPNTGELRGDYSILNVQRFFRSFHRRLFLPNPVGIYVVSLFALALLVSMVAALMFYKRWWRRFLRFRPGRGRAVWSELHKTGGLWSLWFVALMAVTGLWYALEATGAPDALLAPAREPPAVEADGERRDLDALLAAARSARPGLDIRTVYPPGSFYGDDRLRVTGRGSDLLLRDRVNYVAVAADGAVFDTGSGADLSAYEYWVHMADPLHFGDFGGLVTKLIWFAFGLALCGLILTGTWLHVRRLARDAGGRQRWPGTMAAVAVSLLVLAASVPGGFVEARAYGPTLDGARQLPALAPGVAAFLFAWIAATLAIIAAWVTLLWRSLSAPPAPGARKRRRRGAES